MMQCRPIRGLVLAVNYKIGSQTLQEFPMIYHRISHSSSLRGIGPSAPFTSSSSSCFASNQSSLYFGVRFLHIPQFVSHSLETIVRNSNASDWEWKSSICVAGVASLFLVLNVLRIQAAQWRHLGNMHIECRIIVHVKPQVMHRLQLWDYITL